MTYSPPLKTPCHHCPCVGYNPTEITRAVPSSMWRDEWIESTVVTCGHCGHPPGRHVPKQQALSDREHVMVMALIVLLLVIAGLVLVGLTTS